MLVLERLDRSVREALRDKLPLDTKLVAADVARGMAYLHSLSLSHRDVKAANMLLDEARKTAKLSDMGLSLHKQDGLLAHEEGSVGLLHVAAILLVDWARVRWRKHGGARWRGLLDGAEARGRRRRAGL